MHALLDLQIDVLNIILSKSIRLTISSLLELLELWNHSSTSRGLWVYVSIADDDDLG